jgi:methylated-DNA-[protein]-cysteine S-methyltransferase
VALQQSIQTQFGMLTVTEEAGAITRLSWGAARDQHRSDLLDAATRQLASFDTGALTEFTLPLRVGGSGFLRAVCDAICAIPFGETRTYGEIAKDLNAPAQAVGQACGQNPIPVIIPCHRVMGAKGLTGYSGAGGIETKIALLRHEGAAGLLI